MENHGADRHGGVRPRAGRKPVHIDLMQLEKLAALQCTDEELAGWFGVSPYTIAKRRKKSEFAEAIERGKVRGRISVRRAQMKLLHQGNATISIWLGKQLLGQRDTAWTEISGPGGGPIQLSNAREVLNTRLAAIATRLRPEPRNLVPAPAPSPGNDGVPGPGGEGDPA